ncbi:uroporphyrinogen-III C-methyltransferase [Puniceicoccales bacterium CK1056]|uniref:uroporphyrinogen-III C-methyltransferase n=1 Tax=Oceanipulchritudo coccoides TaxID=2706888 RepID=A0A6B2M3X0_9BACT|nr:uroporphyrinogen-III C-methyltransferase [Oceanipulchritudo coccoides]NDV62515.1 uroporphyrinogen-III C-methyltransferase [Oceanipulchritudo coccoides]
MAKTGTVYLVGAGPGDPELLTVKGKRLIESCDALVYDYLVDESIKGWIKPGCELHYVGKQAGFHSMKQELIEALLVELAKSGKSVVRLKGGDPFVFGRGGEEAEALRKTGIPYEVIPAVTAALGCAAYCGIPLTHREWSSSVTFISGHECPDKEATMVDWASHAQSEATLVLYMSMGRLGEICDRLVSEGRDQETPAVVIQWGTTARQKSVRGTLGSIAWLVEEAGLGPPSIVIIGKVAGLGEVLQWFDPSI